MPTPRSIPTRVAPFAAALCLLPLAFATGCGGGGSPSPSPLTTATVTRATEGTLSDDAKILAARAATGPWLSLPDAQTFDADLARIRKQLPQVASIHATPDFALTRVLVTIKDDAPWRAAWEAGTVKTGNAVVDAYLIPYDIQSVESLGAASGGEETFVIGLRQSLNIPALAAPLKATSASILAVDADGVIGDGDRIVLTRQSDGTRIYAISKGWGDCASGCISRHTYQVTLAPGTAGTITLAESGTPLSSFSAN